MYALSVPHIFLSIFVLLLTLPTTLQNSNASLNGTNGTDDSGPLIFPDARVFFLTGVHSNELHSEQFSTPQASSTSREACGRYRQE
jgi:predicted secreted protein